MRRLVLIGIVFLGAGVLHPATAGICVGSAEDCKAQRPTIALIVSFDKNSAELTTEARRRMLDFAQQVRRLEEPIGTIFVSGYTDATGDDEYNQRLSERRADAVVRFLSAHGVETSKLVSRGYGPSRPLVPDPYDPVNRRVETRTE
jgi:OmpA-OmpF porin, OOP family